MYQVYKMYTNTTIVKNNIISFAIGHVAVLHFQHFIFLLYTFSYTCYIVYCNAKTSAMKQVTLSEVQINEIKKRKRLQRIASPERLHTNNMMQV